MPKKTKKTRSWTAIASAAAALAAIAALAYFLPVHDWSSELEDWVEYRASGSLLVFMAVHIVGSLVLVPAWVFPVAAGAIFGLGEGFAVVMVSGFISALCSFLLARYVLRDRVHAMACRNDAFRALDKSVATDGWKVVALIRLAPVMPFAAKNYCLGVTKVRLADYAIATAVSLVPTMFLKVYVGYAGRALFSGDDPWKWAVIGLGLAAAAGATWFIARRARVRLKI